MAPKLLPGLTKIAKAFSIKSRRRNRKDSIQSTPVVQEKQNCSIEHTNTLTLGKLQAICGSSSTTCNSSGYFMEQPEKDPVFVLDVLPPLITPAAAKMEIGESSLTSLYSSDDTGSCPSSPLARRRPSHIRQRDVSLDCVRQQPAEEEHRRRTMVPHHSDKPASFRSRQRNRALSDKDFDQLLTLSRGWTFDPALPRSLEKAHHNRQAEFSSTDFDRYIFAPTARPDGERIRSVSAACLTASPRPAATAIRSKSYAGVFRGESVHPFFAST
jgi:hypothetical protein